jgi:hypothetical protein
MSRFELPSVDVLASLDAETLRKLTDNLRNIDKLSCSARVTRDSSPAGAAMMTLRLNLSANVPRNEDALVNLMRELNDVFARYLREDDAARFALLVRDATAQAAQRRLMSAVAEGDNKPDGG